MLTDKNLKADKEKISEKILQLEEAISQRQQELRRLETQLIRFGGVRDYIQDNISKPKEGGKC